jgi:hypothetical protein
MQLPTLIDLRASIAQFGNQWQKQTPRREKSDKITELMTFDYLAVFFGTHFHCRHRNGFLLESSSRRRLAVGLQRKQAPLDLGTVLDSFVGR